MQEQKDNKPNREPVRPGDIEPVNPSTRIPCEIPFDKSFPIDGDAGVLIAPDPWPNPGDKNSEPGDGGSESG